MIEEIKFFIDICINSLPIGSVYCLLALGFVLILKATRMLNLCQGEIMMLGAYFTYGFMQMKWPFAVAILASLVLNAAVAFIAEKFILRKVIDKPPFVLLLVTVGIGTVIVGLTGILWGVEQKTVEISNFSKMVNLSGFRMTYGKISIILMAIVFIIILELFFKLSRRGMAMRATASNWSASMLMGVNIGNVFSASWILASILAVFPGIFLAKSIILEPGISVYGYVGLSALVLGGMDSILGTIVGGFTIGIVEGLAAIYIGGQSKHLAGFIVLFLVLMVRPTGLFGTKKVERV
jgi:branched-chain amino acid transport system permease protein